MPSREDLRPYISGGNILFAQRRVGIGGMRQECIQATPSWRRGPARYDCVYLEKDPALPGFRGLHATRIKLFFTFKSAGWTYPCALVEWFSPVCDKPDPVTGMWIVEPDLGADGRRVLGVVHLDTIVRCAHLIGAAGEVFLPPELEALDSLDAF